MAKRRDRPAPTEPAPSLTFRASALMPAVTYTIGKDQLGVEDQNGGKTTISLRKATELRIWFEPRRFQSNRFRASMTLDDHKTVEFTNLSAKAVARWEDVGPDYRAFIIALGEAIARRNPDAVFRTGFGPTMWIVHLCVVAVLYVALVGGGIWFMAQGVAWLGLAGLFIAAIYTVTLWRMLTRNRPGLYNPAEPPDFALPKP
ncbi:MAG: hypothetical protein AAFX39_10400 [Pseudomonadota bacterium]